MLEIKSNLGNTYILTETQSQIIAACFVQQLIIAVSIEHDKTEPDLFIEDMRANLKLIEENCPLPISIDETDSFELKGQEYIDLEDLRTLTEDVKITESFYREFIVWSDKARNIVSGS